MTFGLTHRKELLGILIRELHSYRKHKNILSRDDIYLFRYTNNDLHKNFSERRDYFFEKETDDTCKYYLLHEFFSIFSINKYYAEVMYRFSIDNEEEVYNVKINLYNKANHEYLKHLTKSTIMTKSFYDMITDTFGYHRYFKNNFVSFTNVYNNIISEMYSCLLFEDKGINDIQFFRDAKNDVSEINLELIFDRIRKEIQKSSIFTIGKSKNALGSYEHTKIIDDVYNEFFKNNITTLYVYHLNRLFDIEDKDLITENSKVFLGYRLSLSHNLLDRSLYYICFMYIGFSVKIRSIYKYEPILALCKSFRSNEYDKEVKYYIHNPNFDKVPYSINPKVRNDMFFIKDGKKDFVGMNYVISTKNDYENDIDKRLFYDCLYNNKMHIISNILK